MKRLFVCILCVALLLAGCGIEIKKSANKDKANGRDIVSGDTNAQTNKGSENVSGNTAVSGDSADFDISRYDGDWYDGNFKELRYKDTGEVYSMGAWVSLDTKNNKVCIYDISSPPSNRVASVETTYKINGSKAEFEFEDDGWGNAGYGTITFGNSELAVDIVLTTESEDNWEIFSGMLVFGREKNVVEGNDDDMAEAGFSGDDTDSGSSEVSGDGSSEVAGYDASGMVIRLDGTAFDIEYPIEYKDLVNLTADELGILRNGIFAKHGYIFKTKKYTDYFSGFDWYNPTSADVNSKLTQSDKSNIALIQKVERFSEESVTLSEDEKKMTGFWHLGTCVGAGYGDCYRFYEDGTYKYVISQMVMDERNLAHAGKWFILNGYLYLRMEREGILVGGKLVDAEHPSSATEKEIIDAEYEVRHLKTFIPVVLKLDFDSDKIDKEYPSAGGVVIGTRDFYKLSRKPDDIYDVQDI